MTRLLIIGGTDSSGGAGLTRDTATARLFGFDVAPVVTAVTAQSNDAVLQCQMMPEALVAAQIGAALADGLPAAVKIGMLGTEAIAGTVAESLSRCTAPVILDPVLRASSGAALLAGALPHRLLARADLVTPNLIEAAALSALPVAGHDEDIATQARRIMAMGARAVLIKGGHAAGQMASDHLFEASDMQVFSAPRQAATMRGTGCTLATVIACLLARGSTLAQACLMAKAHVAARLGAAAVTGMSPARRH